MPNPDNLQEFEQNPANKVISLEEIAKIEWIADGLKTKEGEEQMLKKISKLDDDFLKNMESQANLILKDINDNTENISPEQLKAMLSLLAINEIRHPWSILKEPNNNGIIVNWTIDQLLAIVGSQPENFKSLLGNWTKVLRKLVDERNKAAETKFNEARATEEETYKNEGTVEAELNANKLTPDHARMYIKNLLTDSEINSGSVNDRFVKIRKKFQSNKVFEQAIDVLINSCKKFALDNNWSDLDSFKGLTDDPIGLENMQSDKIKQFQEFASKCKDKDIAAIIKRDMNWKNGIDGKLWFNTLSAIVEITEIVEKKYKPGDIITINNSVERWAEEWLPIDRMPTTIWWLNNEYWKFWDGNKFQFDQKYIEKVNTEWTKLAVNIEWKKYLLNPENPGDLWFRQTEKKYVTRDADWNEIVKYGQELTFWKFDGDNRFEWTTISIGPDWKQIQSTYFDETRTRYEGKSPKKEVKWQMAVYRLWNNIDQDWNFRWKWRIDLFTDDDAKRLNKDQLNSLDAQDITFVIDQAMAAYDETKHKPSEVWRYNLNRIVYSTMKRTGGFDDLNAPFDTPKTVSHIILWMDTWFFSNPEKKIKESDINDINDEKLMKMLKISKDDVKDYKELKYDWKETTKWDQIINRLKILKAFVEKNKDKLVNKND